MFFWIRYIATLPILAILLTVALVEGVRAAWWVDPLHPAAMIVAPDQFGPVGAKCRPVALVVSLQPNRPGQNRIVYVTQPSGRCDMTVSWERGLCFAQTAPIRSPGVHLTQFRVSPDSGFGPLRTNARLFAHEPGQAAAMVDLEPTRSSGRYELDERRCDWLKAQAGQRFVIYLADVDLTEYGKLRSRLDAAGWPQGPLAMWRRTAEGVPRQPGQVAEDLLKRVRVELAVAGDLPDNPNVWRRQAGLRLLAWPRAADDPSASRGRQQPLKQ